MCPSVFLLLSPPPCCVLPGKPVTSTEACLAVGSRGPYTCRRPKESAPCGVLGAGRKGASPGFSAGRWRPRWLPAALVLVIPGDQGRASIPRVPRRPVSVQGGAESGPEVAHRAPLCVLLLGKNWHRGSRSGEQGLPGSPPPRLLRRATPGRPPGAERRGAGPQGWEQSAPDIPAPARGWCPPAPGTRVGVQAATAGAPACGPPSLGPPGSERAPGRGTPRRRGRPPPLPQHAAPPCVMMQTSGEGGAGAGGERRGAGEGGREWAAEAAREPSDHLKR